jgi:hypothetical protein
MTFIFPKSIFVTVKCPDCQQDITIRACHAWRTVRCPACRILYKRQYAKEYSKNNYDSEAYREKKAKQNEKQIRDRLNAKIYLKLVHDPSYTSGSPMLDPFIARRNAEEGLYEDGTIFAVTPSRFIVRNGRLEAIK